MASLKRKAGAELAAGGVDAKRAKQQQSSLMSFFAAPKAASGTNGTANGAGKAAANGSNGTSGAANGAFSSVTNFGPKFDKAKWVAKLTDEQKKLLKLEIDTMDPSWLAVLKDDLTTPSFLDLKRFLQREYDAGKKIFPPPEDIYSWSRYTPLQSVKVVIVGQDPYHNDNQAHGLAFSVKPPTAAPPSLRNMYVALKNDYPDTFAAPPPKQGGLLTAWAQRGVLMLNTCLTVRAHDANSHSNHGWERFTQRVIDLVAQRRTRGVVFMAWGSPAAKRVVKIDGSRHLVLRSVHPSPLSAHRGFYECGHFRKANDWLVKRYGAEGEIDWSLMPGTSTIVKEEKEEKEEKREEKTKEKDDEPVKDEPVKDAPVKDEPVKDEPVKDKEDKPSSEKQNKETAKEAAETAPAEPAGSETNEANEVKETKVEA